MVVVGVEVEVGVVVVVGVDVEVEVVVVVVVGVVAGVIPPAQSTKPSFQSGGFLFAL